MVEPFWGIFGIHPYRQYSAIHASSSALLTEFSLHTEPAQALMQALHFETVAWTLDTSTAVGFC